MPLVDQSRLGQREEIADVATCLVEGLPLAGSSATSTIPSPPPSAPNFLALPDAILMKIAKCFALYDVHNYRLSNINSLVRSSRQLYSLFRPLLWEHLSITDTEQSSLVLRSWILYPETRKLTKDLFSKTSDGNAEVFLSTALCFEDLELSELYIDAMENTAGFPKRLLKEMVKKAEKLRALRLNQYTGLEDFGETIWLREKCKEIREVEIGYAPKKPERWLGLKALEDLTISFENLAEEVPEGEERPMGSLERSGVVLKHYLASLKVLDITWEGCCCCASTPFNEVIATSLKLNADATPLAPNLTQLYLCNIHLFTESATSTDAFCTTLRAVASSPNLRKIHFISCGKFFAPEDYEEQWKELRLPSVRKITLATDWINVDAFTPMLMEKTLRPLLHLLKIFPSLRFLDLPHALEPGSSVPKANSEELSLLFPALSIFLDRLKTESEIVQIEIEKVHFFRRNKNVLQWESDEIIDLKLYQ